MTALKYASLCLLAVAGTFLLHEFVHWLTGEILGYDMIMTLNTVYPAKRSYDVAWHYTLISATGPLITLLQAVVVFSIIRSSPNRSLYPFLFTCLYMDVLSGVLNLINPNDLGRIGTTLHIGLLTLPAIFVALQFFMVYTTSVREGYSRKFNLTTLGWIMLFSSCWILGNQAFKIIILGA